MKTVEEIALEAAMEVTPEFVWEEGCGHECGVCKHELYEFATKFIAQVDAERGRDAVATFTAMAFDFPQLSWHANAFNMKRGGMLFLSPTIPEGMTLVPKSALEWLNGEGEDFEQDRPGKYWWRSKFKELIQAAGVTK